MVTVRPLTPDDFALGMELKTEAGWNQLPRDWRRAYELEPQGGYVGLCDGVPAATLTTCVFGRVAWIAMVLTRSSFRGRGLATALLKQSLADLERRGVESVRLDATALGRPVYEKLGFTVDSGITRFYGKPTIPSTTPTSSDLRIRPFAASDVDAAATIDRAVTGNDRTKLLRWVHEDWPEACFAAEQNSDLIGFGMARRGSRATQIGPVVTHDSHAGCALLAAAFERLGDSGIYLDVPHENPLARDFVLAAGMVAERDFFRMTRGNRVDEKNERVWANYGPEKG